MKTYHIALNIDDKYLEHASATLASVFHNNIELHFAIHVITAGLSKDTIKSLNEFIVNRHHNEFYIYKLSNNNAELFSGYANSHISQAANYRLFIANILPENIDRVLYLDCDLIVKSNIKPLFDLNLKSMAVAAVEDMWSGKNNNYIRLDYPRKYGYFNSGVMMISLKYWREHELSKLFVEFFKSHPKLIFIDQDILNGVLHAKWLKLPLAWNVQDGFLRCNCRVRQNIMADVDEACKHPLIIHFTGSRKPWNYNCLSPFCDEYFKFIDMTDFKGTRPIKPILWTFKLAIDRLLLALRLKTRRYRKSVGGRY